MYFVLRVIQFASYEDPEVNAVVGQALYVDEDELLTLTAWVVARHRAGTGGQLIEHLCARYVIRRVDVNFNNATERRVVRFDLRFFNVKQLKLKFYDKIHTNVIPFTLSSSSQVPISMWLGRSGAAVVVSGAFVVDPPKIFQSMIPRLTLTNVLAFTSSGDDDAGKANASHTQQTTRKALLFIISTLRFSKTINNLRSSRLNWIEHQTNILFLNLISFVQASLSGEVSFRNMRILRWDEKKRLSFDSSQVRLSALWLLWKLIFWRWR